PPGACRGTQKAERPVNRGSRREEVLPGSGGPPGTPPTGRTLVAAAGTLSPWLLEPFSNAHRHRFQNRGFVHFEREIRLLAQHGLVGVCHALRPDAKASVPFPALYPGWDFPGPPNPFPFVEALVENVVFAQIALGPVTAAVAEIVAPANEKRAYPVAAFSGNLPRFELQKQLHRVPSDRRGVF